MENILDLLNSPMLYLISGTVIFFVVAFSLILFIKSYKAGLAIGMEKKFLLRSISASATFTALPSVSILLGVIALAGSLGLPLPWLRLSVLGALHYETSVADIAAKSIGLSGLNASEMTPEAFTTIALVMTIGVIWGMLGTLLFLKKYTSIIKDNNQITEGSNKKNNGDIMMTALFIGLIGAYIGCYVGVFTSTKNYFPILTVVFAVSAMALFDYLQKKYNMKWLESFSLAASMFVAMIAIVIVKAMV